MIAETTAGAAIALVSTGMLWTARHLIQSQSPIAVGCVLGLSVGAIFGMHLGLSI